uniref:SCAN box domain-containing protein n=1 Tax=Pseudonaja textilis TaxID=8673 RepID=A0A670YX51_PSETE
WALALRSLEMNTPRSLEGEVWPGARQEPLPEKLLSSEVECFRRFCYLESAGSRELCSLLQQLCHRWLKPKKSSRAQVVDRVIVEQFLALLPPEMAGWQRDCGMESYSQAVALAEGFHFSQAEEQRQQVRESILLGGSFWEIISFHWPGCQQPSALPFQSLLPWPEKVKHKKTEMRGREKETHFPQKTPRATKPMEEWPGRGHVTGWE